ncbi:hypothetical protein MRS44_013429 [Fusarium solani]|uniref:uncharacterized protein n=1 Tax=Fusarium solani TaxID=169388 RepID=UPI0032C4978A|nr:hypothetical protein MRS44_013429 [Fusarium solani]
MPQSDNETNILLALQTYKNDPKLSLRRAAKIYQLRYSTLFDRENGVLARCDTTPNSRKPSDLEEHIIIQFIVDLYSRGFPPWPRGVGEMTNRLLADRDASPGGKRRASNFVKRHPGFKARFHRKYEYQRAKCEDPTAIRN